MKQYLFPWGVLALMAVLVAPPPAWADYHGIVRDGWGPKLAGAVDKVANAQFDEGLAQVQEYITAFPNECGGYFYYAAAVQEALQKKNDLSLLPVFLDYADKTQRICGRNVAKNPEDWTSRFYLGAINGYLGLVKARQREMIEAFQAVVEARKQLEAVHVARPDMPDNQLALGMLYYFATRQAKKSGGILGWIITTFITDGKDRHDEGVRLIQGAIRGKALSEPYATASLMWIRLYENNMGATRKLAADLAGRYPHDTISRWVLGRVDVAEGKYQTAKDRFAEVERLLRLRKVDVETRYSDVLFMQDWCAMMLAKEADDVATAMALNRKIESWLHTSPKVGVEYQVEDEFLAYWNQQALTVRRQLKRQQIKIKAASS